MKYERSLGKNSFKFFVQFTNKVFYDPFPSILTKIKQVADVPKVISDFAVNASFISFLEENFDLHLRLCFPTS